MFQSSSHHWKGTWLYKEPNWETRLDELSDYYIEQTGLSKEKLYKVLEIMAEHGVISNN